MAGGAFWLGASPGINTAGGQLLLGPALADKARASELKGMAESSLLMQKLRETAVDAERKLLERNYLAGAPDQARLSAAANYGTTLPDIARAESMLRNPEPIGIEGPRWEDSPEFSTARRALSEAAGATMNPDKVTLPGLSGYRKDMVQVPGEQAKSDAITSALARIQGGDVEGAYDITGPILGHNAPVERDQASAFVKTLKAGGIDPASPEGQRMIRAYAVKQSTHAPGTNVNVMPASSEWVRGADGRWYKWRLGKSGQQELVAAPEGYAPGSPTEDPIDAMLRQRLGGGAPAAAPGAPAAPAAAPVTPPKRIKFDAQGNRVP